ncbi:TPA: NAD-dependent epimerase/dehydratase family protein [Candidatus Bathyarchaeota archaeon]|nr:NAD-dependent epimerase/dehydratase family protein [Candidatus Bathyarchaeota archaeon]
MKEKLITRGKKVLVTGGAGFIGSHVVDFLMKNGLEVNVLDNLSGGSKENLSRWLENEKFKLFIGDCLRREDIRKAIKDCCIVFHLAANAEVRVGSKDTKVDLEQNIIATHNILEEIRYSDVTNTIIFTSTSTVYGDASIIPTPEDYGPLKPISLYGASKLACEAMISAYSHLFGVKAVIYRFANIVGPRSRHGVIWDFIHKLTINPRELEILGDGTQSKSYLHVSDCVEAFIVGLRAVKEGFDVFNVGSEDRVDVNTIARIVIEEMGLEDVKLRYKIDVNGGRGWLGDVKFMLLDISKLKSLGWRPRCNSAESIRLATREILTELRFRHK